jgi:hypothetical protein
MELMSASAVKATHFHSTLGSVVIAHRGEAS